MPLPLPHEESVQNLLTALLEWKGLSARLLELAGAQLMEIDTPREEHALAAILAEKQRLYEAARVASERVVEIGSVSALPSVPEREWARIHALRAEIGAMLQELERVEAESRETLAVRMQTLRAQLDTCRAGARMHNAYAKTAAGPSRFLDNRY